MALFTMMKAGSERISDVLSLPVQKNNKITEAQAGVVLKIDKVIASWSFESKSEDSGPTNPTTGIKKSPSNLLNSLRKGGFKKERSDNELEANAPRIRSTA
jgi:hypothetical protein